MIMLCEMDEGDIFPTWPPRPIWNGGEAENQILVRELSDFKVRIMTHLYLREGVVHNGPTVSPGTFAVSIAGLPGSGKHSTEAIAKSLLEKESTVDRVLVGKVAQMNMPGVKAMYRRDNPNGVLNREYICLSQIGYAETLRLRGEPGIRYAIDCGGPLGNWTSGMLLFGENEFNQLMTERQRKVVWETPTLSELASNEKALIDKTWEIMMKVWKEHHKIGDNPRLEWSMTTMSLPILMISDLSPEKCWGLQKKPSQFREDQRTFRDQPFSRKQILVMRLIHTAMARDLDFVETFGKFDVNYNNGGAERQTREMLGKAYKLYRRFKQ